MVDTFDKVSDTVVECLLTGDSELFVDNSLTDELQITNDEIKCIAVSVYMHEYIEMFLFSSFFLIFFVFFFFFLKSVISKFMDHNRNLGWWFEDIGKTLLSLIVEARECPLRSGPDRTFVISSFYLFDKFKIHFNFI